MEKDIFAEERQREIVAILRKNKKVFVNELSDLFNVSQTTIRTDLTLLEEKGYLKRTHGGAVLVIGTSFEMTNKEKEQLRFEEKYRIGEYAASLVKDGDSIVLDTGTTTRCFVEYLKEKKNLTVITNDLKIALLFEDYPNINTIFIGGVLRKEFGCTVGSLANEMIEKFNADKSFIVTNTVDDDFNLCTPSSSQADTKRHLLNIGKKKILLCDSTKFSKTSLVKFANLMDFDEVITDSNLDKKIEKQIISKNINLKIV